MRLIAFIILYKIHRISRHRLIFHRIRGFLQYFKDTVFLIRTFQYIINRQSVRILQIIKQSITRSRTVVLILAHRPDNRIPCLFGHHREIVFQESYIQLIGWQRIPARQHKKQGGSQGVHIQPCVKLRNRLALFRRSITGGKSLRHRLGSRTTFPVEMFCRTKIDKHRIQHPVPTGFHHDIVRFDIEMQQPVLTGMQQFHRPYHRNHDRQSLLFVLRSSMGTHIFEQTSPVQIFHTVIRSAVFFKPFVHLDYIDRFSAQLDQPFRLMLKIFLTRNEIILRGGGHRKCSAVIGSLASFCHMFLYRILLSFHFLSAHPFNPRYQISDAETSGTEYTVNTVFQTLRMKGRTNR